MIFDSHAHYNDERFYMVREQIIDSICHNGKVGKIVNIGASLESSRESIELSKKYDFFYASVGVHPSDAVSDMKNEDWLSQLEKMYTDNEKVVAIGEIGLDYYYGTDDKQEQKICFDAQMKLASKLGARVVIHDRDAHADVLDIIKKYPSVTGVVHSFSGNFEMAKELVKLGYFISVNGVVTFKNAKRIVEILQNFRQIDENLEHLLVETDCPYLTPVPHRGELNHSDYICHTAEKCAELLGITSDEFCDITYKNACRFYGLE